MRSNATIPFEYHELYARSPITSVLWIVQSPSGAGSLWTFRTRSNFATWRPLSASYTRRKPHEGFRAFRIADPAATIPCAVSWSVKSTGMPISPKSNNASP